MIDSIAKAVASGDHTALLLLAILFALAGPLALIALLYLLLKKVLGKNGNGAGGTGHVFSKGQEQFIDGRVVHKWNNLVHADVQLMVNRVLGEVRSVRESAEETAKQLEAHLREAEPALRELEVLKETVNDLKDTVKEIRGDARHSRDILIAVAVRLGVTDPSLKVPVE